MMNDEKKQSETWLDLRETANQPQNPPRAPVQCVTGTLDSFPDAPGGYDGILIPVNRSFLRWNRWYFQCFTRQLKDEGRLLLVPGKHRDAREGGGISRIRQWPGRIRWWAGARIPCFTRWSIPPEIRGNAARYGLHLNCGSAPGQPRAGISAISFRKGRLPFTSPEAAFQSHFGSWFKQSSGVPLPEGILVADTAELTAPDRAGTVMVLSPHPDDELIGCGGTLLGLITDGWKVHVVQMTEGATCSPLKGVDNTLRRSIRWEEAKAVASRFGFEAHYWATGSDGVLLGNSKTQGKLRALLDQLQPKIIFVPSAADLHPDHRTAGALLQTVSDGIPAGCRVFEYPVWGFLPDPTHAVEVTGIYPGVLEALHLYPTALKAEDYVTRCQVLSSYFGGRILGDTARSAEVFSYVPDPRRTQTPQSK